MGNDAALSVFFRSLLLFLSASRNTFLASTQRRINSTPKFLIVFDRICGPCFSPAIFRKRLLLLIAMLQPLNFEHERIFAIHKPNFVRPIYRAVVEFHVVNKILLNIILFTNDCSIRLLERNPENNFIFNTRKILNRIP